MGKKKQLPGRQRTDPLPEKIPKIKPADRAKFEKNITIKTEHDYAQSAKESRKRIAARCKGAKYKN